MVVDLEEDVDGGTDDGYDLIVVFFTCASVFYSPMSSVSFFKWLERGNSCLFLCLLFSLSLVPLTRIYWCLEIVVSAM